MEQEFTILHFNPSVGEFEQQGIVGDGGMEKHRERHQCSYAANSGLTAEQYQAALAALDGKTAEVLVFASRATRDLFLYKRRYG